MKTWKFDERQEEYLWWIHLIKVQLYGMMEVNEKQRVVYIFPMGGKPKCKMKRSLMDHHHTRILWIINDDIYTPRVKMRCNLFLTCFFAGTFPRELGKTYVGCFLDY